MNESKNKNDEFLYSIWNFFAASLSEKTRKNYYNVIKAYIKITGHSPLELTESDTEKYFNDLKLNIKTKYVERPIAITIGLFLKEGGYYEGSNNYYCFNANWCTNRCFHNVLFTN